MKKNVETPDSRSRGNDDTRRRSATGRRHRAKVADRPKSNNDTTGGLAVLTSPEFGSSFEFRAVVGSRSLISNAELTVQLGEADMKIQFTLLLAFLISLAGGQQLRAQQPNQPPTPDTVRFGNPTGIARVYQGYLFGVIQKKNRQELVLDKTKFGVPQTIKLDKKTKFIQNGKRGAFAQLQIGEDVYVDVKKNKKTGEMLAKKVVTGIDATQ
jgi:hypothetical protein